MQVMPRKPRFFLPEVPVHIVQRGHNREPVFADQADFECYLNCLGDAAFRHGVAVHAYVLMTNHVHFLVTPDTEHSIAAMLQMVGRHFGPYLRRHYGGSGSIWSGRYKASLVQSERYLLLCMRYIELNPVRAGMVSLPGHYRWSSYRANAQGQENVLLTPQQEYLALAQTGEARQEAYKALFKGHNNNSSDLGLIRATSQTGTPLGNDFFKRHIEKKLGCKLGYTSPGRPKKKNTVTPV